MKILKDNFNLVSFLFKLIRKIWNFLKIFNFVMYKLITEKSFYNSGNLTS